MTEQLEEILFKKTLKTSKENQYPLQVNLLVEHILFSLILEKHIANKSKLLIRKMKWVFLSFLYDRK